MKDVRLCRTRSEKQATRSVGCSLLLRGSRMGDEAGHVPLSSCTLCSSCTLKKRG